MSADDNKHDDDSHPDLVWELERPDSVSPKRTGTMRPPPPPDKPSQSLFPRGIGDMILDALAGIKSAPPPAAEEEGEEEIPVIFESIRPEEDPRPPNYRSLKPPPPSARAIVWAAIKRRLNALLGRNT